MSTDDKLKDELLDIYDRLTKGGGDVIDMIEQRRRELHSEVEEAVEEQVDRVEAFVDDAKDTRDEAREKLVEELNRIKAQAEALGADTQEDVKGWFTKAKDAVMTGVDFMLDKKVYILVVCALLSLGYCAKQVANKASDGALTVAEQVEPAGRVPDRFSTPVRSAGDYAQRVFYRGGGSAEWGTVCEYGDGFVSVDHVTANGEPKVGTKMDVTYNNTQTDFSVLGIDVQSIDLDAIPVMKKGDIVYTAGFPAGDTDGEFQKARVLLADIEPGRTWLTLEPLPNGDIPEGFVGGQSGSCVLNEDFEVVAVVHANSFSTIAGTYNAHVLVVPLAYAVAEAQGKLSGVAPMALVDLTDDADIPKVGTAYRLVRNDVPPMPTPKPCRCGE